MRSPAGSPRPALRGLRFFEAGADVPMGLAVSNGQLGLVDGAACIRQSLVTLLSTRPGERVMRPRYGCDLDAIAFAPMGPTTFMLAKLIVRRAVERFEPRVAITGIDVIEDPTAPSNLLLTLGYRIKAGGMGTTLAMRVPTQPDAEEVGP